MELVQSAIQYASWPVVALVGLLLFREPISRLLRNMRFFKTAGLEVGFSEQLQGQGFTDAQLKVIRKLSASEIDLFLLVSFGDAQDFNYTSGMEPTAFRNALLRLQEAGLLLISNPDDAGINMRHSTTPIGRRVRAMLVNSTVVLLHANT